MSTRNNAVIIDNQSDIDLEDDLFEVVFNTIQEEEGLSEQAYVNLLLSADGSIQRFNRRYLGRDEITDVISFPAEIPGVPLLGDIIIDTNAAAKQKAERTLKEELQILFLHGMLHLLGYDHLAAKQEKMMRAAEEKYLKCIKENNKLRG